MLSRLWKIWYPALTLGKVGAGILATLAASLLIEGSLSSRLPVFLAFLLCYSAGAILLLVGGHDNRAALFLGNFLLVGGSPYAGAAIQRGTLDLPLLAHLDGLTYLQLDALLPFFLWRLAAVFPSETPIGRARTVARRVSRSCFVVGLGLLLANALMSLGRVYSPLSETGPLGWLRRRNEESYYWPLLFALTLAGFAFLLWRIAKVRRREERNRGLLFIAAIAIGAAPLLVLTIGQLFSESIRNLVNDPQKVTWLLLFTDSFLLSIPFTTAYAVLVHRVLDVKLILRKALQYAFARYTVLGLTLVPMFVFGVFLYQNRHQTLSALLTGRGSLLLVALAGSGLLLLRNRDSWFEAIDRHFFREQFDAHKILASLIERTRSATDGSALSHLILEELDQAIHPQSASVFLVDSQRQQLSPATGGTVSFPLDSPLARLLVDESPLLVNLDQPNHRLNQLPEADVDWLCDSGFRLLVPITGTDRRLLGLIALGEKKSELPFSQNDLLLLKAVAASSSVVLERSYLEELDAADPAIDRREARLSAGSHKALECSRCGKILQPPAEACHVCRSTVEPCPLPSTLNGKFRLLRRIGRGGMGVVYLAQDLTLDREVALKTLPRISPRNSHRLRHEARTIAQIAHPNLAIIHGAETWRRAPILIFEFLEAGTLDQHIAQRGRLPATEVLGLGLQMTAGVACIHDHGILHRDVKPSNIGYSRDGVPKLLDFGLAKLFMATQPGSKAPSTGIENDDLSLDSFSITSTRAGRSVVGTPLYLSPEALRGHEPDYSFDIWGLCVVLFEALTGLHPFRGRNLVETLARLSRGQVPSVPREVGQGAEALNRFFGDAFHKSKGRRPRTAAELKVRLSELQDALG